MPTLEINLDGYTDLPSGKIANVVTYFEMTAPPVAPAAAGDRSDLTFRRVVAPRTDWFRTVIRAIGEEWLWFSPLVMADAKLAAILESAGTEVHVLERAGETVGLAQLDRGTEGEVEIAFFGVVPSSVGQGLGRHLMARTLAAAFVPGVRRVWLHTCTFDHPAAVPFYLRCGFAPYKLAIEVTDDPRLTGHLRRSAGRHIALVDPSDR